MWRLLFVDFARCVGLFSHQSLMQAGAGRVPPGSHPRVATRDAPADMLAIGGTRTAEVRPSARLGSSLAYGSSPEANLPLA